MKIDANSIKVGQVLEHKNKLCSVLKVSHTQPGKGGAYVQCEMKEIISGTKLNIRFRSNEMIEKAHLEEKKYQFLYYEGDKIILMDNSSYEQINVPKDLLGDQEPFLVENMEITARLYNEKPISVELPDDLEVEVRYAEPSLKGQTAASSYKPAELENGVKVMVPPFVNSGDRIIVKVSSREYVEKAKG